MVKLGLIVEGDSEVILFKHPSFSKFLQSIQIEINSSWIINAGGKNNLFRINKDFESIETKVNGWINTLLYKGVDKIFIMLDMDDAPNYKYIIERTYANNNVLIIAKRALEAWYLADTLALNKYLKSENVIYFHNPEEFINPFEELRKLRLNINNKGISDKKILATHFLNCNFSIKEAVRHPNCSSVQYFYKQLQIISEL